MTTYYFETWYEEIKKHKMVSYDSGNVLLEKDDGYVESFAGFVQLFSSKTANTLKNTALASYSVHAILSDVQERKYATVDW